MKIVMLDGHAVNPGDLSWEQFESLGNFEVFDRTPEDAVIPRAARAEAVLTTRVPLSAKVLEELGALRYIGAVFTGYDGIDLEAARRLNVTVTNVPGYSSASVGQLVFALLLEACHHVALHSAAAHAGEWSRSQDFSFRKTALVELQNKIMGIIGFGRIGRYVGSIAVAMGMRVIACSRTRRDAPGWPGFRWCDRDELLSAGDVVSLHCPLLPETRGLIDANALRRMRPGAVLINTARGQLIVEKDLANALNEGRLACAGVDVLSVEPPLPDNPLLHASNCIITPHIAWATTEARQRLLTSAAQNLRAFLEGHPINVVSKQDVASARPVKQPSSQRRDQVSLRRAAPGGATSGCRPSAGKPLLNLLHGSEPDPEGQ